MSTSGPGVPDSPLISAGPVLDSCVLATLNQTARRRPRSGRLPPGRAWPLLAALAVAVAGAEQFGAGRVHDGTTFSLEDGRVVRLIGIRAPSFLQPGGDICRDVLEKLVSGRALTLEAEGPDQDESGRLRRWVFSGDTLVNAVMVRKGFAETAPADSGGRYADTLAALQETAARIDRGLWPFGVFEAPRPGARADDIDRYLAGDSADACPWETVRWDKAPDCIGRLVRVVGEVVATYRSDKVFIMNFHEDYRRHFKVAVFASDLPKFPPSPEDYYKKRIVRVTGLVREFEGAPEMIVTDPEQIEVLE